VSIHPLLTPKSIAFNRPFTHLFTLPPNPFPQPSAPFCPFRLLSPLSIAKLAARPILSLRFCLPRSFGASLFARFSLCRGISPREGTRLSHEPKAPRFWISAREDRLPRAPAPPAGVALRRSASSAGPRPPERERRAGPEARQRGGFRSRGLTVMYNIT